MSRMNDKVALVVGGARGIGYAVAERPAAEGAAVVLTGRSAEMVAMAANRIGDRAGGVVADAASADDVSRVVAEIRQAHGRLDALVLNAGLFEPASIGEETPEHFDRHFRVNVRGQVLAINACLPVLDRGASVVLIGSIASVVGVPGRGAYSATKAALRSYARTWTAELAPRGIRVNVVSPGPTDTALMAQASREEREGSIEQIPLGRMARPDEVAAAAMFLLSDDASFVTGTELFVDGGMQQV